MERISQKDIDWLLNLDKKTKASGSLSPAPKKKKRIGLRIVSAIFLIVGVVVLPFFLLIRTSVFLNLNYSLNGWVSLGGGVLATVILLLIYMFFFFRKFHNKKLLMKFGMVASGTLVLSFCVYGLMYLSSVNAKTNEVREVYRSMHPIMRVAIATATLADSDLVVTDIKRSPEDYAAMGLPVNESSLHFPQESGYVHAIDLRTKGRPESRNFVLNASLRLMGLETIRHVGTADHLHVALPTVH